MKRIFSVVISVFVLSVSLAPNALAGDTASPQLVDFSIDYLGVKDISKSDASFVVRFILSDDSEIETPNLLLKSLTTTQTTPFATVKELSRSGKLVSYEATAIIKVGQSPRIWEWVLYPLRDLLGNTNSLFGPGVSWKRQVHVLDENYNYDVAFCEGTAKELNEEVQKFLNFEVLHPGEPELAVARLKSKFPIEKVLGEVVCSKNAKTVEGQLWGNLSELQSIHDMAVYNFEQRILSERVAKEEAEYYAALEKAEADWKAKEKQAALDKILADVKVRSEVEAKAEAARILAAAKVAAAKKKTTITCAKGKLTKKVTAVKPVCPKGYKKK
ncbi:hypothetical protein MCEMKE14_00570 [Candidatus Nanopelagicaceae bacterium]